MSEMWAYVLIGCMIALVLLIPLKIYENEKNLQKTRNKRNFIKESDEKYSRFLNLYDELTKEDNIIALENFRKEAKKFAVICCSAFLLVLVFAVVMFNYMDGDIITFYLLSTPTVIIGVVLFMIAKNKFDIYSLEYKKRIFAKFVKLIDENFEYSNISKNNECIEATKAMYIDSGFEYERIDKIKVDDYFSGKINQNDCRIFDVMISKIHYGNRNRREKILFYGLFVNTEIKNIFSSEIRFVNKKLLELPHKNKINFNDEIFNKNFNVYAEDVYLAEQIFTPDIIQLLNEYYEKFDIKYEFIIRNSDVYMRFHTGPMFEPMLFEKEINKELLYSYYCTLRFVIEINKKISDVLENS